MPGSAVGVAAQLAIFPQKPDVAMLVRKSVLGGVAISLLVAVLLVVGVVRAQSVSRQGQSLLRGPSSEGGPGWSEDAHRKEGYVGANKPYSYSRHRNLVPVRGSRRGTGFAGPVHRAAGSTLGRRGFGASLCSRPEEDVLTNLYTRLLVMGDLVGLSMAELRGEERTAEA